MSTFPLCPSTDYCCNELYEFTRRWAAALWMQSHGTISRLLLTGFTRALSTHPTECSRCVTVNDALFHGPSVCSVFALLQRLYECVIFFLFSDQFGAKSVFFSGCGAAT